MTTLASVRIRLESVVEALPMSPDAAKTIAAKAMAELDAILASRPNVEARLLAGVSEDCITRAEPFGGGAMDMRARLGVVEVSDIYIGDESSMSDQTIRSNAKQAVLDSLRVELVRRDVTSASDLDLLDALDAAERGGDEEVGEIRVAAQDRGLRLL